MQEDLAQAYDVGIAKGTGRLRHSMNGGTPVVPVRKAQTSDKPASRICGDCPATVNPQLETHRHPLPLTEELMRRLGGGYGFTKTDLADACNWARKVVKARAEHTSRSSTSEHTSFRNQFRP